VTGRRVLARALIVLAGLMPTLACAQDVPGRFDFYVLSLSWSPSYCEAEGGDRGMQCNGRRSFAFVLHGLWPQYERGWPESCAGGRARAPSRAEIDAILPVMPSPGLVRHQWAKHGTCSGLDTGEYLDLMREAFDRIALPSDYARVDEYRMVSPRAVEAAFVDANPGLPADGIAVTCDNRRLREVRLCLTRDLQFRACPEVDARGCGRGRVVMPPVR
jgi:ribonuclease T2